MSYSDIKFSDLKGKVLVDVKASDDNITFVTLEGESSQAIFFVHVGVN